MDSTALFAAPWMDSGNITPRPYQVEALEALDSHMRFGEGNPLVVIPTGGGKSVLMAWAIQGWKRDYPPFRCVITAHRKELVEQNANELARIWPEGHIGVFAAGLRRRDREADVTYASIDSIYKRAGEFAPWDVVIVDEAHRIPPKGEGKYRRFLKEAKNQNGNLKIIGFTATPFRMNSGPICHRDHILNEICYEADVADLIAQGYLCKLRSKRDENFKLDLSQVKKRADDYVTKDLAVAVDTPDIVRKAVRSAVEIIFCENRQSCMFFCVNVKHCQDVALELRKYGFRAPLVTGQTPLRERERIAADFKRGTIRAICNVNVYTEGFDAKKVDCIVLLRPTLSPGLYMQMVGRGLRIAPGKTDCLVLDYAHCIAEHGPIDCIKSGEVKLIKCGKCGDDFSRAIGTCPHCGWTIPKREIERLEGEERERRMHEIKHSNLSILSDEPEEISVDDVSVFRHHKIDKPDSIRVEYRCGIHVFREWICLDHEGFASTKATRWWRARFGAQPPGQALPYSARVDWVFNREEGQWLAAHLKERTEAITIRRNGKHFEIVGYRLLKEETS